MRSCSFRIAGIVLFVSGVLGLSACSPATRPVAKAVPTETLKVNPELVKKSSETPAQSK